MLGACRRMRPHAAIAAAHQTRVPGGASDAVRHCHGDGCTCCILRRGPACDAVVVISIWNLDVVGCRLYGARLTHFRCWCPALSMWLRAGH
jgi:hypothetical protein